MSEVTYNKRSPRKLGPTFWLLAPRSQQKKSQPNQASRAKKKIREAEKNRSKAPERLEPWDPEGLQLDRPEGLKTPTWNVSVLGPPVV